MFVGLFVAVVGGGVVGGVVVAVAVGGVVVGGVAVVVLFWCSFRRLLLALQVQLQLLL